MRALELLDPPPSTLVLADWAARLGQNLFYPPNVGGWPGGRAWLSTRAAVGRCNYAAALLEGEGVGLPGAPDVLALTRRHGRGRDREDVVTFFAELLLGGVPSRAWRERLLAALGPGAADPDSARRAAILVLSCPESWLV